MRRRARRAILVLLAMAGLSLVACGGGDEEDSLSPILQKFRHRVHGTISRYDASAKTFTATDKKGRAFAFSMDDKTKMEGRIADGAMATVRYRSRGTARMATIVKVFPTATPAAPATTTPAPAATTGEKKKP